MHQLSLYIAFALMLAGQSWGSAAEPPVFLDEPTDQQVELGQYAHFWSSATGSPPLFFQWRFNGQDIPGQTESFFENYLSSTNQAGYYQVVVWNAAGAITSRVAVLTITVRPPEIIQNPEDQTVDWGSAADFSGSASGSGSILFQWQRNGRTISGGNDGMLHLPAVTTNHAGDYRLVASNPAGKATSAVARLTVLMRTPQIITQPEDGTADAGEWWQASVVAVGAQPISYRWQFNDQDIPDAIDPSLYHYVASTNDVGRYQVVVSNFLGSITSEVAHLIVLQHPPEIFAQPASQSVGVEAWSAFGVGARGSPPLFFQWQRDGMNLAGGTNSSWYQHPTTTNDAGGYRVVVSNVLGVVTSELAALTVEFRPPAIIQQPASVETDAGSYANFCVNASGAPWPDFHWQREGVPIPSPGSVGNCLSLVSVTSNDAGAYRVIVSNYVGVATSEVANLMVRYRPPEFLSQPASRSVLAGDWTSFSCIVAGGPPPLLQWYHNGMLLPDATNSYLSFVVNTTNQAGFYAVAANNSFGTITSAVVELSVTGYPPNINTHPVSHGIPVGDRLGFLIWASGNPPPAIQWQHNRQDIPQATNEVFTIDEVTTNDAGNYRAVVRNESGAAVSREATLTVVERGPLDQWVWRNPLPQGNDLRGVVHGNGVLVAVGSRGARVRSVDGGATWQDCGNDDTELGSVIFGNGLFVGLPPGWNPHGNKGMQTSVDGFHWSKHTIVTQPYERVAGLVFGNGRFVAVTDLGASLVSTNGTNWSRIDDQSSMGFTGLVFGNGRFVATLPFSYYYVDGQPIATSEDGVAWTSINLPVYENANGLIFASGQFRIYHGSNNGLTDAVAVSGDGLQWTNQALNRFLPPGPFAFGAGRFLTLGKYYPELCFTSLDGINWSEISTGLSNSINGLHFDGSRFVAVGDKGVILIATNGEDWIASSPGSPLSLHNAAYGNHLYVTVGDAGLIRTSPDGRSWTRKSAPTSANLRGVAFGNGRFVAVGDLSEEFRAEVLVSLDGIVWTRIRADVFWGLNDIAFGNGRFVAVGEDGVIAASADGLAWTSQYSENGESLHAITCGNGKFVAVGNRCSIVTSTGGGLWVTRDAQTNSFLHGVAWGNGLFLAGGQSGVMVASADGENWFDIPAFAWPSGGPDIEDVQFAAGTFVASGSDGFLATSTDAALWIEHRTGCQSRLGSLLHAGGYVTAVGDNDTILQSDFFGPPILKVRAMRNGEGFEFSVDGESGRSSQLQASEDLVNWEDVFLFNNTHPTTIFLDPDGELAPRRFYRVVSP